MASLHRMLRAPATTFVIVYWPSRFDGPGGTRPCHWNRL